MRLIILITFLFSGCLFALNSLVADGSRPAQSETWMIIRSDREGYNALYRMRVDGSEITRLTGPILPNWQLIRDEFRLSPDGEWLYFAAGQSLQGVRVDGSLPERQIVDIYPPAIRLCSYENLPCGIQRWSSDGRWMFFHKLDANNKQQLFRGYANGERQEQLTFFPDHSYIVKATDDGWMLIRSGNRLYAMHESINAIVTTRMVYDLSDDAGSPNQYQAVSPDDEWVIYLVRVADRNWELYRVRPNGQDRQNITNAPDSDEEFVGWIAPHPATPPRRTPDDLQSLSNLLMAFFFARIVAEYLIARRHSMRE